MSEYGLFNDEGCVENGFRDPAAAARAALERYSDEDELTVSALCDQHPEQSADYCEECEES